MILGLNHLIIIDMKHVRKGEAEDRQKCGTFLKGKKMVRTNSPKNESY